MSGYAEDYSRSQNAENAEEEGRLPLTRAIPVLAKRAGVTRKIAKEALKATHNGEWHHTGCKYRCTEYYELSAGLEYLAYELRLTAPRRFLAAAKWAERQERQARRDRRSVLENDLITFFRSHQLADLEAEKAAAYAAYDAPIAAGIAAGLSKTQARKAAKRLPVAKVVWDRKQVAIRAVEKWNQGQKLAS